MLDINLIRQDPRGVAERLAKRMPGDGAQGDGAQGVDFTELLSWDEARRSAIVEAQSLQQRRNEVSKSIPRLKKEGKEISALLEEMKQVSARIKELNLQRTEYEARIQAFLERLPNIPDPDVAPGGKENNVVVSSHGDKPRFDFPPADHMTLVESLGLVDYERGAKMGGAGFWLYRGTGALLEWALIDFFIEEHRKDGYEFVLPPHILLHQCGYTAGQFPKFEEDVYHLRDDGADSDTGDKEVSASAGDRRADIPGSFLLPTAETALINLYRDEILREEDLPQKLFAYTPCYRREAGSYRSRERGMIRGHQFNKVEMFQFTTPADSDRAFDELLAKAERLMQALELHYRVVKLAAGDCSAAMARTYDVEVWIPSMEDFIEVSSVSNARDYQARRGNIRYKRATDGRNEFIHTLNASGLATSRLLPAIVEQFQQADGSVLVPGVLQPKLGMERLEAAR